MKTETPDSELILDHLTTAVIVADMHCRVLSLNQSAEQILAVSQRRARGKLLTRLIKAEDEDLNAIGMAIEENRPFTRRQAQLLNSRQQPFQADLTLSPLQLGSQSLLLIELNQLDRLLRINREESQMAAFDTSRNLARGLAHEIKNPLGGIRGAAQLLHNELHDETLREYTGVITQEADRLRNLVDKMLGPNSPPRFESMNVHQVLERVILLLQAESEGEVEIVKDYDPSLPDIRGDLEQLIQAVLNIARNALEALMESATKDARIILRTRIQYRFTIGNKQHPLVCRIDVEDNGPGIPAEIFEEIFYPTITNRHSGSGLGLPIAQSVIASHQGLIEYDSSPLGTSFSIYLPAQVARDD